MAVPTTWRKITSIPGEVIHAGLEKTAKDLGVDIRTGTKGEDLILDGKDVTA